MSVLVGGRAEVCDDYMTRVVVEAVRLRGHAVTRHAADSDRDSLLAPAALVWV
jgi:hypothetical protein